MERQSLSSDGGASPVLHPVSRADRARTSRRRRRRPAVVSCLLAAGSLLAAGCGSDGEQRTFLDSGTIGTIEIDVDQEDLDQMIETFSQTGEKEWIEATVTIDGATYRQAGLRLKGNSSLFELMSVGAFPQPGELGPMDSIPDLGAAFEIDPDCVLDVEPTRPADEDAEPADPAKLPWMIRLDKFVEDQSHQGRTRFAVRGSNDPIPLVEALSIDLLGRAGLASQGFSMVRFGVNGGDEKLRLVVEIPDDHWMEDAFGDGGNLYKADSTGNYEYRGDNQSDYDGPWSHDGGDDEAGFAPLIDFLRFVNESSDEEFEEQLDQHLDVEAFARYLAFQDLIVNDDDIGGPGNNSYLHIDADGRATVVAWDHNLAFAGATGNASGFSIGVATEGSGGEAPSDSLPEIPEGCDLPIDMPVVDDEGEPIDTLFPGNLLADRFRDNTTFSAMIDEAHTELRASLFDNGTAATALAALASTVRDSGLAEGDDIDALVAAITEWFPKD